MISSGHNKHANIARPDIGIYGRFELGIIGAPCGQIRNLVDLLSSHLEGQTITYVDADHQADQPKRYINLTDKIGYDRIDSLLPFNAFDRKILLQSSDIIFVNGNHFQSAAQIVICTEKKRDSLQRKLDRLTDVKMIILDEGITAPHDFLKSILNEHPETPVLQISQTEEISDFINSIYLNKLPVVKGLVLAGGKSQRMGENKAFINYHGMPQADYACQLLSESGVEPFISCRKEHDELFNDRYPLLYDSFEGLGPFGAILTAFRSDPNSAWITIACDQPLLSQDHLSYLISNRNSAKMATCYFNPDTGFPEPLITLWEPKAYPRLLSFLSLGYSCPRKVLINSDVEILKVGDHNFMTNANTQEERAAVLKQL